MVYIIVYLFTPTLQVLLTQHILMTNNYMSYKRKNNSLLINVFCDTVLIDMK